MYIYIYIYIIHTCVSVFTYSCTHTLGTGVSVSTGTMGCSHAIDSLPPLSDEARKKNGKEESTDRKGT